MEQRTNCSRPHKADGGTASAGRIPTAATQMDPCHRNRTSRNQGCQWLGIVRVHAPGLLEAGIHYIYGAVNGLLSMGPSREKISHRAASERRGRSG